MGIGTADCESGDVFSPLHLKEGLMNKTNYDVNGKYGVMTGTSQKLWGYGVNHLISIN